MRVAITAHALSVTLSISKALNSVHVFEISDSNHGLNGNSSPVSTGTPRSYEKGQNSTLHKIKSPEIIEIKVGAVDRILQANCAKYM